MCDEDAVEEATATINELRVAIVHDWLVNVGGAERVLKEMVATFHGAQIYAVCNFLSAEAHEYIGCRDVRTTFIQRLPFARRKYRAFLPLMPLAIEQLDLREFDAIVSCSHAVAKGVVIGPNQVHVAYVHSPMRYAWDMQAQYLRNSGIGWSLRGIIMRWLLHRLRLWDVASANRVDAFVANSDFIRRRIEKTYRRDAAVIYPPVNTDFFRPSGLAKRDDYYLTVSRLVPYKRVDVIVEAFRFMSSRRLLVLGDGPEAERLKNGAPRNVTIRRAESDEEVRDAMQRARAYVFAAEEDFGIAPVEAEACGTPVIAYRRGGSCETVMDMKTGILFDSQTPDAIREAVCKFEATSHLFDVQTIRAHALQFDSARFRKELLCYVAEVWRKWRDRRPSR